MYSFGHQIHIDAPVDRVTEFVMTPENWVVINPSISEVTVTEEREDGFSADLTYKMVGVEIAGRVALTVVEPYEHVSLNFAGKGMTGRLDYRFIDDDETIVRQEAEYELTGSVLDTVLEPVAKRYNERQFKDSLVNMKELLEAETPVRM